jgi:hypothetical protein
MPSGFYDPITGVYTEVDEATGMPIAQEPVPPPAQGPDMAADPQAYQAVPAPLPEYTAAQSAGNQYGMGAPPVYEDPLYPVSATTNAVEAPAPTATTYYGPSSDQGYMQQLTPNQYRTGASTYVPPPEGSPNTPGASQLYGLGASADGVPVPRSIRGVNPNTSGTFTIQPNGQALGQAPVRAPSAMDYPYGYDYPEVNRDPWGMQQGAAGPMDYGMAIVPRQNPAGYARGRAAEDRQARQAQAAQGLVSGAAGAVPGYLSGRMVLGGARDIFGNLIGTAPVGTRDAAGKILSEGIDTGDTFDAALPFLRSLQQTASDVVNTDPAANRRALEGITNTDTAANRAAIGDRIPQGIKDFADLFREKPGQDYAVPFAEVDPAAGRHDDIANLLRTEFETTHRPEGLINAANALWPGNVAMGALKAVAPYVGQVETASGDPQAPVHRVFGSFGQLVGGPYTSATLSEEGKQLPGWGMAGTGARSMERVANWAADHPQEAAEWAATTPFPGMENTQTPIGMRAGAWGGSQLRDWMEAGDVPPPPSPDDAKRLAVTGLVDYYGDAAGAPDPVKDWLVEAAMGNDEPLPEEMRDPVLNVLRAIPEERLPETLRQAEARLAGRVLAGNAPTVPTPTLPTLSNPLAGRTAEVPAPSLSMPRLDTSGLSLPSVIRGWRPDFQGIGDEFRANSEDPYVFGIDTRNVSAPSLPSGLVPDWAMPTVTPPTRGTSATPAAQPATPAATGIVLNGQNAPVAGLAGDWEDQIRAQGLDPKNMQEVKPGIKVVTDANGNAALIEDATGTWVPVPDDAAAAKKQAQDILAARQAAGAATTPGAQPAATAPVATGTADVALPLTTGTAAAGLAPVSAPVGTFISPPATTSNGDYTPRSSGDYQRSNSSGGYRRSSSGSSRSRRSKKTSKASSMFGEGFPFNRPDSPLRQQILAAIAASMGKAKSKKKGT